nr:MAG TPA: hypothetical protein [Caudoviricetes sp.]
MKSNNYIFLYCCVTSAILHSNTLYYFRIVNFN